MKKLVLSLMVLLVWPAYAADEHGRYWIYGVGRQACTTYLEARKAGGIEEISYKNWIMGYLTAINQSSQDTYNLLGQNDFQGAMEWLDQYCRKNPSSNVYMAMANMVAVMYPQRRQSK